MKTQRKLLLIVLIIVLSSAVYAADYDTYKRAVGAQVGQLSSYGLSFHNRLNSTSAIQTTIGLMYQGNPGYSSYLDYGLGLEYQHTFFADTFDDWLAAHLYWFIGLNHSATMGWDASGNTETPFTPVHWYWWRLWCGAHPAGAFLHPGFFWIRVVFYSHPITIC